MTESSVKLDFQREGLLAPKVSSDRSDSQSLMSSDKTLCRVQPQLSIQILISSCPQFERAYLRMAG